MQEIYIGNGQTEYHLHSINQWLPTIVFRGVEGLDTPTMRIDAYDNPGTAGETVAQVLPGGSLITLSGALRTAHAGTAAAIQSGYLAQRQAFLSAITHTYDDLGRANPLLLRFTDLSGRTFQTNVYRDRYSAPHELPVHNEWNLQLRNPAGEIYSQTTQTAMVDIPTQGGVAFDLVWDIVFGQSGGGLVQVTNSGDRESHPIIRLHGPMANPVLTNTTTNEFIGLTHEMLDGDVITIDTANSTIIQGETTNRMGKLKAGSVLWSLQPGDNTITLQADEHTDGFAEIAWRSTYSGV